VHLDLTAIPDGVITDIEVINLTGSGNNSLTLAHADLLALNSTVDMLRVNGNAGDVVNTTDSGWAFVRNVTIGAQVFAEYAKGGAILQVDTDVSRSGIVDVPPPVNEAPTAVQFANTTTAIAENTDTTLGMKVADIVVVDDALGSETLALTGSDAASFEIVGSELRLKAGLLDFETKSSYVVQVTADDPTVGGTPDATSSLFTVSVTDVAESNDIDLATLSSAQGFRILGADANDQSGQSVSSAGDVNGDGFDDLIVGARTADAAGNT
jgi:hypothetical protein